MAPNRHEPDDDRLATLADAALAGDEQAVKELVAELNNPVLRYCRARIGSQYGTFASADDVAQEVLIAVLHALPRYGDTGNKFLPFVFGIARNKVADYYRRESRHRHATLDEAPDVADDRPGPDSATLRTERADRVHELLNTLPGHQREALFLRVGAGYTAEEAAAVMCTTAGAVRVTQYRALKSLRRRLDDTDRAATPQGPASTRDPTDGMPGGAGR